MVTSDQVKDPKTLSDIVSLHLTTLPPENTIDSVPGTRCPLALSLEKFWLPRLPVATHFPLLSCGSTAV